MNPQHWVQGSKCHLQISYVPTALGSREEIVSKGA